MKEILLSRGLTSKVDDEDYDELNKFIWHAHNHGKWFYAARTVYTSMVKGVRVKYTEYMHRNIIPIPDKMEIDHINGNTLDNRKENLRIVTHRENCQNFHIPKTSKYNGIYWNIRKQKWYVRFVLNGKQYYLGSYIDEIEAATVYRVSCVNITGVDVL
jgi:hypothetical protein